MLKSDFSWGKLKHKDVSSAKSSVMHQSLTLDLNDF